VTKVFLSSFDDSIRQQGDGFEGNSGANKTIQIYNQDEEIIANLCADYTIYRGMDAFVVVEVAFTQTRDEIRRKLEIWKGHSTILAVIIVHVEERPRYQAPGINSGRPRFSDWGGANFARPFGPVKLRGCTFAGTHTVHIEIWEKERGVFVEVSTFGAFSRDYIDKR
jgi:hypothetical protein